MIGLNSKGVASLSERLKTKAELAAVKTTVGDSIDPLVMVPVVVSPRTKVLPVPTCVGPSYRLALSRVTIPDPAVFTPKVFAPSSITLDTVALVPASAWMVRSPFRVTAPEMVKAPAFTVTREAVSTSSLPFRVLVPDRLWMAPMPPNPVPLIVRSLAMLNVPP